MVIGLTQAGARISSGDTGSFDLEAAKDLAGSGRRRSPRWHEQSNELLTGGTDAFEARSASCAAATPS